MSTTILMRPNSTNKKWGEKELEHSTDEFGHKHEIVKNPLSFSAKSVLFSPLSAPLQFILKGCLFSLVQLDPAVVQFFLLDDVIEIVFDLWFLLLFQIDHLRFVGVICC